MSFAIRVTAGKNKDRVFVLKPGKNFAGRKSTLDIPLVNERDMEYEQFELEVGKGKVYLRDLSKSGTLVNRKKIYGVQELKAGDTIDIGRKVCFVLEETGGEPGADAVAEPVADNNGGEDDGRTIVMSPEQLREIAAHTRGYGERVSAEVEEEAASGAAGDAGAGDGERTMVMSQTALDRVSQEAGAVLAEDSAAGAGDGEPTMVMSQTALDRVSQEAGAVLVEGAAIGGESDEAAGHTMVMSQTALDRVSQEAGEELAEGDGDDGENAGVTKMMTAEEVRTMMEQSRVAEKGAADGDGVPAGDEEVPAEPEAAAEGEDLGRTQVMSLDDISGVLKNLHEEKKEEEPTPAAESADVGEGEPGEESSGAEESGASTGGDANREGFGFGNGDSVMYPGEEGEEADDGGIFGGRDDDDENDTDGDENNDTDLVQTRMATIEEITFIKLQLHRKQTKKMVWVLLVLLVLSGLIAWIWDLHSPVRESVLSWPEDISGQYPNFIQTGSIPDGIMVYYPNWPRKTKVYQTTREFAVETFIGVHAEVPLNIYFTVEQNSFYVYQDRAKAVENTMNRLERSGNGLFSFEKTSQHGFLTAHNVAPENGVPVDVIVYQRVADRTWYGILRFFRFEDRNYVLRVEFPIEEKLRALPSVSADPFVVISQDFVRSHWEGNPRYYQDLVPETALMQIKGELDVGNAPMQFPYLELKIKSLLAMAKYNEYDKDTGATPEETAKRKKIYEDAGVALRALRRKQHIWHKEQHCHWISATLDGDEARLQRIKQECGAVFSLPEDKRHEDVQREYWE